jgi:hypothetical protein
MMQISSTTKKLRGSCHCGAVKFEVEADPARGASRCNCSVCTKLGALGSIVKPCAFRLVTREAELGVYEWGAKISKRYFCFGRGHLAEVGGDYVSFSYNAVDDFEVNDLTVVHWDGRHNNWQAGPGKTPFPILTPSSAA